MESPEFKKSPLDNNSESETFEIVEEWTLGNDLSLIGSNRDKVQGLLEKAGWTEDDFNLFILAVDEAVSNAIIHGNLGIERNPNDKNETDLKILVDRANQLPENKNKLVTIELKVNSTTTIVKVTDQGKGYSPEVTPTIENMLDNKKAGGRGVAIMRQCSDEVQFNKNEVTLIKYKTSKSD